MRYAVVDVETTGLAPRSDRVIDICVVQLDESGHQEGIFSTLVRIWPPPPRSPESYGLAPSFQDIATRLVQALEDRALVGHNVRFDLRMLQAEFQRCGITFLAPQSIDTVANDRLLNPKDHGQRSLFQLASRLGLSGFAWHTAEGDARATAKVFQKQLTDPRISELAGSTTAMTFEDPRRAHDIRSELVPLQRRNPKTFPPTTDPERQSAPGPFDNHSPQSEALDPSTTSTKFTIQLPDELLVRIDQLVEAQNARPEVIERKHHEDELLENAGALSRDEAYDLWDRETFRTKASLETLDQIAETFRLIGDTDELMLVLYKSFRMHSMHHSTKADSSLTELVELLAASPDDDLQATDTASELLYALSEKPLMALEWLPTLTPIILRDEESFDHVYDCVVGAIHTASERGDLSCGLALIDSLEPLVQGTQFERDIPLLRFELLKDTSSDQVTPRQVEDFAKEIWQQGVHHEMVAEYLLKQLINDGEAQEALEFGKEALQALPNSRKLRAIVGRVHRQLDQL